MRFQHQHILLVTALLIGCGQSVTPTEPVTPLDADTAILPDTTSDVVPSPDGSTPEDGSITIVEATGENEYLPPG